VVAAIGFSRLALGVHDLSDVAGGYLLGTAWAVTFAVLFDVWPLRTPAPRPGA
jgi:undecaprenyl-diphosphatase